MRRFIPLLCLFVTLGCQRPTDHPPGFELNPPVEDALPITANEKLTAYYPAGSRIPDRQAPGGFGLWPNYPNDLEGKNWGAKGEISVVAFPEESVAYFKGRGIALRVVNRTAEAVPFQACDSFLSLVAEALDSKGNWCEIETPNEAICGNSFHRVFLAKDQYWEFPAREYSGPINTKLRYRLDIERNRPAIYSNEFEGNVSKTQLN